MTRAELAGLLTWADARSLREDAGISLATVAAAFGVTVQDVEGWEALRGDPGSQAPGAMFRWGRFIAALDGRVLVGWDREAALGP